MRGLRGIAAGDVIPGDEDDLALLDRVVELAPEAAVPAQLRAVRERSTRFEARVERGREAVEDSLRDWLGGD